MILWIRKDGLSGDMTMKEGKIIYMESGLLNVYQELSFGLLPPELPELL